MRLEGDAWQAYFDNFERDAFRLETLPVYRVESEREKFQRFLEAGQQTISADNNWHRQIRHWCQTGRWIGRVHVVTRPISDYLRFEFEFYAHSVKAGEDIRILDLTDKASWTIAGTAGVSTTTGAGGRAWARPRLPVGRCSGLGRPDAGSAVPGVVPVSSSGTAA